MSKELSVFEGKDVLTFLENVWAEGLALVDEAAVAPWKKFLEPYGFSFT